MSERSLNLISGAWVGEGPGTNNLRESQQTTPVEIEEYLEEPNFIRSKALKEQEIKEIHRSSPPLKDKSPIQNDPEEDLYTPTTKPSNPDIIIRKILKNYDYLQLEFSFNEAVAETLKHYKLAKKTDLVNNGQIKDMDTAHHLLASFREQIVKNDSSRRGDNVSLSQAKKLNNQEQGMFKLLLQRKLGLDFGHNVAGETNHKYFMFTVDRARLDRLGKNKITANQAS